MRVQFLLWFFLLVAASRTEDIEHQSSTENPKPDEGNSTTVEPETHYDNSTDPEEPVVEVLIDESTFSGSMNYWDFRGKWAKYNLSHIDKRRREVPDLEGSKDHVVFINEVTPFTSLLRKRFPPLINGTLAITHFLKFTDIFIVGMTVNAVEEKQVAFVNATKERWSKRNHYWITETFDIGTHNTSFEIIFKSKTSSSALWAIDIITVEGIGDGTHSTNHSEVPPAVVPPSWHHNGTDEDNEIDSDDDFQGPHNEELTSIASSMWQAIYVFIALFLLVLILFIILMIRQKRKLCYLLNTPKSNG